MITLLAALLLQTAPTPAVEHTTDVPAAVTRGLNALASSQNEDGSWGKKFKIAVTAMGGLAILAADEKALESPSLWKTHDWLMKQQKEGDWPSQGHTWLHSQGFAALFFAELYGRALGADEEPEQVDLAKLKDVVEKATILIAKAQSETGGWYYQKAAGSHQHEGSTTVCAVQALRAAKNFGIAVDQKVLDKGFDYLKRSQNKDGGFQYNLGSGSSMVAGTAGAISTLILMEKLDEKVLFEGLDFLKNKKVAGLAGSRFPYYGLFYGMMGMTVVHEEYGKHVPIAPMLMKAISKQVVDWQKEDGTWDNRGWMLGSQKDSIYATALATLTLVGPGGRLSIFHRYAPKLEQAN